MHFGLSRPQQLLQTSLRELLARECPISRVREIGELGGEPRDAAVAELRRALAEQGALGVLVAEDAGGLGGTLLDATVVAQELGRALAPISLHEGWVLGARLLAAAGGEEARERLEGLASGHAAPAVASDGLTLAGGSLRGEAIVAAGPGSELLAAVEDEGRVRLARVDPAALEHQPIDSIDLTRPLWTARWTVRRAVTRDDGVTFLGDGGSAASLDRHAVQRALDAARIAVAADLVGAAHRALEIAVAYSLERRQFGRPVGSYQAVKHVCAERAAALEPVQSLLWQAAHAWDRDDPDHRWLAPLLQAHAAEVAMETVTQATQVFGGMGFTWECDAHLYYKRVAQSRQLLGGPARLRAEAARLRHGEASTSSG